MTMAKVNIQIGSAKLQSATPEHLEQIKKWKSTAYEKCHFSYLEQDIKKFYSTEQILILTLLNDIPLVYICYWQVNKVTYQIGMIEVRPDIRRAGNGRAALIMFKSLCHQRNISQISLRIKSHEFEAKEFWRMNGVDFINELFTAPDDYDDGIIDLNTLKR
ncbi:MAG: hypothetical protein ACXWQQ_13640 [Pseudobdellovibrio sp.]